MRDGDKCLGISGWLFGHNMVPVFEQETRNEPDPAIVQAMAPVIQTCYEKLIDNGYDHPGEPFDGAFEGFGTSKRTYIHHICIRCGKTVAEV